ncbi:MAG: sulfatase-like hydrolase/transferase, partial [Actinobacteria bacterium]|nr:sulfatase-like hydrolase/transferase [Actinomycetota bacterium]NIS35665.1 sulfatase-like hydrolase/transferase [Actinomycetota bacterium]NIU21882.1 sulfatase-like hydrolase/transferase [Actinomycetota bacterium]NIU70317.1 sulfatase-like hydrolase/transferase [Actinomycetota bacterium]NIV89981.1 sulfatase-like hydrolase/transferase [Actinomycetota bacterium]
MSRLPGPDHEFGGRIGPTPAESVPDAPPYPAPPEGAPNVLIVMLDDVGFGHPDLFGGPVRMPTLRHLSDRGLRYTNFHT